jgi:hypothetical protein
MFNDVSIDIEYIVHARTPHGEGKLIKSANHGTRARGTTVYTPPTCREKKEPKRNTTTTDDAHEAIDLTTYCVLSPIDMMHAWPGLGARR